MNFLNKEDELLKLYNDFEHYHCDICEKPYKTKKDALYCCIEIKLAIINSCKNRKISPNELQDKFYSLDVDELNFVEENVINCKTFEDVSKIINYILFRYSMKKKDNN